MQINHFVSSSLEENVDIKNLNYFLYENDLNIIKKKTNNLNYKLVKPFFYDSEFKKTSIDQISKLEEKYFFKLQKILSEIHKVEFSEKAWRVILCNWLRKYIYILYNRYFTAKHLLQNYNINSYNELSIEKENFISENSLDFISNIDNPYIDNFLFSEAFKILSDKISIKTKNIKFVKSRKKVFLISKKKIKNLYNKIIYPIAKNNDLVLHSSYMGFKNDLLIQIKNKQVPFFLSNEDTIVTKFNIKFREDCKNRYFPKSQISFEGYLDKLLFSLLPISFLESFKLNIDKTERLNWPKKPQIIFSANSFEYDDLFKIWAASKITKNSKIIFAQHGGNYGTNRFLANNTVEEQVADIFLTWGWTDNKKKKAFYFLKKTKKINNNKGKKITLFLNSQNSRILPWDVVYEYNDYRQKFMNLVKQLNFSIHENLVVKLHPVNKTKFQEKNNWIKFKERNNFNFSILQTAKVDKIFKNSKLLICGTDTTIYLESLITGIPTILLFQNNNLDEIKKSELKNYKILEEHGLLYFDAQKAAKKINEIVLNPNDWWQQDKIQYAIQNFKDNYVRQSNNLSNDFLRLIKNYFVKV